MNEDLIPFNALDRAVSSNKTSILGIFEEIIDSGWFVNGPNVEQFEHDLAIYLDINHALSCANGTDALTIALRALDVSNESVVMTSANAGGYATTAINLVGAKAIYSDVDANSHLITLETILESINRYETKPDVVVLTHLYGGIVELNPIIDWAKQEGVKVVEDCAQALGGIYQNRRVGTFGDIGTTSFYPTKNLGALGDGGALFTQDSDLGDNIRKLRQYGWSTKYVVTKKCGTNSRLDEIQAALLRKRLQNLDNFNEFRRRIHQRYENAGNGNIKFVNKASSNFVGHLAVVETENRRETIQHFENHGIKTEIHYPIPDHKQPFQNEKFQIKLLNTENLAEKILSIPLFPELTEKEINRIESAVSSVSK